MQDVLDNPRGSLSYDTVVALLTKDPVIQISYGCARLDYLLNPIDDITEFMSEGAVINRDSTAQIQGSCSLLFDSDCPLDYLAELVQPYMVISNPDNGDSATFYLGVYTLQTPLYDNSLSPTVQTFPGYDLNYYLNQPLGDSYMVAAGSDPITSAVDLIASILPSANINFVDTARTLADDMTWPTGQNDPYNTVNSQITYLSIVNDLLNYVGYQPLWVDWNGSFQILPYTAPIDLAVEWTFDLTDTNNVMSEQRSSTQDIYDVPNQWQFIMSDLNAAPVEGDTQYTYDDTDPNNITSQVNRPFLVRSVIFVSAADYDSLVAIGTQQILLDLAPTETLSYESSPFPLAWQFDQVTIIDPNLVLIPPALASTRRAQAIQWSLPLDGQTDMTWIFATVANVGV